MRACFKNVNTIPASIPVSLHKVDRPVTVRCVTVAGISVAGVSFHACTDAGTSVLRLTLGWTAWLKVKDQVNLPNRYSRHAEGL